MGRHTVVANLYKTTKELGITTDEEVTKVMLKKLIGCACLMMTVLWLTGAKNAHAVMFMEIIDPVPDILVNGSNPYSYTHDITVVTLDNPVGFDPLVHHLGSASITIEFMDNDGDKQHERVDIDLEGALQPTFTITGADFTTSVNVASIQSDGLLSVTLTADKGDFLFKKSTLVADTTNMPEPSSLILLGTGLVGAAGMGLRRRKKETLS